MFRRIFLSALLTTLFLLGVFAGFWRLLAIGERSGEWDIYSRTVTAVERILSLEAVAEQVIAHGNSPEKSRFFPELLALLQTEAVRWLTALTKILDDYEQMISCVFFVFV